MLSISGIPLAHDFLLFLPIDSIIALFLWPMTFSCSMILTQSLFLSLDNDLLMFLPIDLIHYSFDLTPSLLLFLFIDLNHHSFISSVTFCSFIFTSFIVPLIWPVTFFCFSIIGTSCKSFLLTDLYVLIFSVIKIAIFISYQLFLFSPLPLLLPLAEYDKAPRFCQYSGFLWRVYFEGKMRSCVICILIALNQHQSTQFKGL